VPDLTDAEFEALRKLPKEERSPPEEQHRGEYWPTGQGQTQLENSRGAAGKRRNLPQKRGPITSGEHEDSQQKHNTSDIGFVKRADRSDVGICEFGEDCYPFPYPIEDMYEWYKDATW
jgi:hypothetical protein